VLRRRPRHVKGLTRTLSFFHAQSWLDPPRKRAQFLSSSLIHLFLKSPPIFSFSQLLPPRFQSFFITPRPLSSQKSLLNVAPSPQAPLFSSYDFYSYPFGSSRLSASPQLVICAFCPQLLASSISASLFESPFRRRAPPRLALDFVEIYPETEGIVFFPHPRLSRVPLAAARDELVSPFSDAFSPRE